MRMVAGRKDLWEGTVGKTAVGRGEDCSRVQCMECFAASEERKNMFENRW
jgi:hypothetical protein